MKWQGRPKSKNIIDARTPKGGISMFVNEQLAAASQNKKTGSRFGKQGSRKKNTGYKTGGGF